jgi:phosphatidylglycerol:prolipoprotein diacylglycerol transferase
MLAVVLVRFLVALLLAVMLLLVRSDAVRARTGMLTGVFLCGYAVARIIGEFFREPDPFLGYFAGFITMGMILSVPLCLVGIWLLLRSRA